MFDEMESVLANVLDPNRDAELDIIAEQVAREVRSGRDLDQSLTEAQAILGLSFSETKKLAEKIPRGGRKECSCKPECVDSRCSYGMHEQVPGHRWQHDDDCDGFPGLTTTSQVQAEAVLDKYAGLKSTLRKLRKQLEQHDNSDLDGMNKLLTCIKGVEDQLKQKDDKREERRKKRESEPESELETEARIETMAAPLLGPDGKPLPGDMPGGPGPSGEPKESPLPTTPPVQQKMLGDEIDLMEAAKRLEAKLAEVKSALEQAEGIPELQARVMQNREILIAWLKSIEGSMVLVQRGAQKYKFMVQKTVTRTDSAGILKRFVELATDALKNGEQWAEKALAVMRGILTSPAYKSEVAPTFKAGPTPKKDEGLPHEQLPPSRSALRVQADLSELEHILDALQESLQTFNDYLDVAENNLNPELNP